VQFIGAQARAMGDRAAVDRSVTDERTLIRRIVRGEIDLFADIIDRYQTHVARIVGRHVPSERVPEVAHDVFVRAYGSLGQFAGSAPFDHWLAGIAVRTCYDFWRAMKRSEMPVSALTEDHQQWIERALTVQSEHDFQQEARRREAKEVLDWGLGRLSPENRLVLTLVHLEGHSVSEAAKLLGWSVVNVKVRAHRARRALRKLFLDEGEALRP
jgi:RNA polymerase sigma-70 factor, ECF subfamily